MVIFCLIYVILTQSIQLNKKPGKSLQVLIVNRQLIGLFSIVLLRNSHIPIETFEYLQRP